MQTQLNLTRGQELSCYSCRIKDTWTYIIGENEQEQLLLDANTVDILQGRCPCRSSEDRAKLEERMLSGDIFPTVKCVQRRGRIFDRICSIEYVIPSLYLLAEDSKYLEGAVKILKQLLPKRLNQSVSQCFAMRNMAQAKLKIQTSEFAFQERESPSPAFLVWASYCQLALAAFRHFPFMGGPAPRKARGEDNVLELGDQEHWWYEISSLASELGYKNIVARYADRHAADLRIIRDCLRRLRPAKYYDIDPVMEHRKVVLISQVIDDMPQRAPSTAPAEIVSDVDDCGWNIANRCGMPYTRSFKEDVNNLFFDNIYSKDHSPSKRYLTSFGIKRDMFHAFFGRMPDDLIGTFDGLSPQRGDHMDLPDMCEYNSHTNTSQALVQQLSIPQIIEHIKPEAPSQRAQRNSNLSVESQYTSIPLSSPSPPIVIRSPIDLTEFSVGPWVRQDVERQRRLDSSYVFEQQELPSEVTFAAASRLLFGRRNKPKSPTFTVLSPTTNGGFRKRQADPQDKRSMISALRLPSGSRFMTRDNGKRLKIAGPSTIIEEAESQRLDTVIAVPQHRVQELIHQFENNEDSEEEL